jgi:hypothetical protein
MCLLSVHVQAGALPACVESLGDYFAAAGIVGKAHEVMSLMHSQLALVQ